MAAKSTLTVNMTTALREYIEKQLEESYEKEFENAVEQMRLRKDEIIAKMAVRIAKQYDIRQSGEVVTIAVREVRT